MFLLNIIVLSIVEKKCLSLFKIKETGIFDMFKSK